MKRPRNNTPNDGQSTLSLDAPRAAAPAALDDVPSEPANPSAVNALTDPAESLAPRKPQRRATAEMMAARQREISVSEFFTKNRHLLGFDNPAKALLTAIKEAVDNSLDACEEAGILPDIRVEVEEAGEGRFRVAVQDNGPGIVRAQVPKIFAKLLYGSKFHHLKQSRGQQGIGISAAGLYAQLTTGKPVVILSKTGSGRLARRIELRIDTRHNKPEVLSDVEQEWEVDHGTRVELELAGTYRGGRTSIDAYLEQTVIANPHMSLWYKLPKNPDAIWFDRAAHELPREPIEIKPHPHGVELGLLIRMMQEARGQSVKQTLMQSFSRVSASVADQVCAQANIPGNTKAPKLTGEQIEALHNALGTVRVMAPPASCVVPIGEDLIIAGLRRRFNADFYTAVTRPPAVYRGNPFVVECGIAHGGELSKEDPADIMRFANRVPLQYQPKACATTEAVYQTNWKAYQLTQPRGSLPIGPLAVVLHLASVWVPFTSEAKEAVAHYPELLKEMRLAIQEAGRRLATHLRARHRAESELKRRSVFERYIPELGASLSKITSTDAQVVTQALFDALPNFVNVDTVEDDSPNDDIDDSGRPSMPPPSDALDDETPRDVSEPTEGGEEGEATDERDSSEGEPEEDTIAAVVSEEEQEPERAKKPAKSAKAKAQPDEAEPRETKKAEVPTRPRKPTAPAAKGDKRSQRNGRQLDLVK
jgi:DNA topoisomerase-6 subunit B